MTHEVQTFMSPPHCQESDPQVNSESENVEPTTLSPVNTLSDDLDKESDPQVNFESENVELATLSLVNTPSDDLDIPITLRKGVRSCT